MAGPVNLPLSVSKRVPFDNTIPVVGVDYTGAAFLMHVRNEYGAEGSPLITLGPVSGSEGLSVTLDPEYVFERNGVTETASASIIRIQILEATLEALALNTPASSPLNLVYDIHVTPSGGTKFVLCEGTFSITPGSTI